MSQPPSSAFINFSVNARNQFLLSFFAAIFWLLHHIQRSQKPADRNMETVFESFPFLSGYLSDMRQLMPDQITWEKALVWWQTEFARWEKSSEAFLPLLAIEEIDGIDFRCRILLILIGLVEEDSRFGDVFSLLQPSAGQRRPTLELAGQIMRLNGQDPDPWRVCRPLLDAGFIETVDTSAPRSEWVLRVPNIIWDLIRGESPGSSQLWFSRHTGDSFPDMRALVFPEEFLNKLGQIPELLKSGKTKGLVLRGTSGSGRLQVAGAVARALERRILLVDGSSELAEKQWQRLGSLCTITRSIPVISCDLAPGESAKLKPLTGYKGPAAILAGFEGGLHGGLVERSLTLTIPWIGASERQRLWLSMLQDPVAEDIAEISHRFHLPGEHIRRVAPMAEAQAALDGRRQVQVEDVRIACRALNRQMLDTLATRLDEQIPWHQLVLSDMTASKLKELERRCRHREGIQKKLGSAFQGTYSCGVRALLTGVSGTGKTLAAKVLATELGKDLYRVDLASVVNKYIGETEKNLNRVLSRAEELDVILLLDEGDALLGRRTDVKSANDRYANLETNYLLQRLENYHGIVLVTTNAGEHIDKAFLRRMDVVVSFILPTVRERWQIWEIHLPQDHHISEHYLEEVAARCSLSGGQIRNAALQTVLLAVDNGDGKVARWHLEKAIRSEYRKAGAVNPLDSSGRFMENDGNMDSFINALSR
jgi:hypothetical protein